MSRSPSSPILTSGDWVSLFSDGLDDRRIASSTITKDAKDALRFMFSFFLRLLAAAGACLTRLLANMILFSSFTTLCHTILLLSVYWLSALRFCHQLPPPPSVESKVTRNRFHTRYPHRQSRACRDNLPLRSSRRNICFVCPGCYFSDSLCTAPLFVEFSGS